MNHYDCIVAGFGTAGSVAAIAAGRLGASVLVLESGTAPGGTHTVGGVGCYYFQQPVPGSLMAELDAACRHLISQSCWSTSLSETKKHVIEEKAAEAGLTPRIRMRVGFYATARLLVTTGVGFTIQPAGCVPADFSGAMLELDETWSLRELKLCVREETLRAKPEVGLLIESLKENSSERQNRRN